MNADTSVLTRAMMGGHFRKRGRSDCEAGTGLWLYRGEIFIR